MAISFQCFLSSIYSGWFFALLYMSSDIGLYTCGGIAHTLSKTSDSSLALSWGVYVHCPRPNCYVLPVSISTYNGEIYTVKGHCTNLVKTSDMSPMLLPGVDVHCPFLHNLLLGLQAWALSMNEIYKASADLLLQGEGKRRRPWWPLRCCCSGLDCSVLGRPVRGMQALRGLLAPRITPAGSNVLDEGGSQG